MQTARSRSIWINYFIVNVILTCKILSHKAHAYKPGGNFFFVRCRFVYDKLPMHIKTYIFSSHKSFHGDKNIWLHIGIFVLFWFLYINRFKRVFICIIRVFLQIYRKVHEPYFYIWKNTNRYV